MIHLWQDVPSLHFINDIIYGLLTTFGIYAREYGARFDI